MDILPKTTERSEGEFIMKKTVFAKTVGISANTLAKLSHNEMVSMEIIVRICRTLHCTVDDIMDILPETTER